MFNHFNTDSHSILQQRELRRVIEEALSRLPLEYLMVFSLREINGLAVAETAQVLDISESNVKVRLNREGDKLRSKIEKSYTPSDLFEFNLIYCNNVVDKVFAAISGLPN